MTKADYDRLPELLGRKTALNASGLTPYSFRVLVDNHPGVSVRIKGMTKRFYIKTQLRLAKMINVE
jgi:hypothetical protein